MAELRGRWPVDVVRLLRLVPLVRSICVACCLCWPGWSGLLAQGALASPVAESALDQHVMAVAEQLRCLVCQNQTIADSHADLAIDLRRQVREKIQQGLTDQQILDYMVQRYGDFVLYRPPLHGKTWLLWCGPFLFVVAGLLFLLWRLRKQATVGTSETGSP